MKIYPKLERLKRKKTIIERKVKVICTHCGHKQRVIEKNYSIDDIACKLCGKKGSLKYIK
ncbi:MAG: hypothetical protein GWO87_03370 [Xanthomonadaceae bacterium]|nr:hypothetical protein [Rhodospirillaceae bacterium]NIA18201.1 hypothetical protein [Xanthomonadaceae bacterium]